MPRFFVLAVTPMEVHCPSNGLPLHHMIKYLTRHGNSLALVIDRPILDLLKITPEAPLEISTDGQRITISVAVKTTGGRTRKSVGKSMRR